MNTSLIWQKKNALKEALRTLLAHQYVTSELLPEVARTCVTIEGSGMGNIHSGEVAGSVFTKKVEIPFLDPDIQEIFDLRGYGRYRDDILVFIGYRTAENFIKAYTKTAEDAGYEITVDQRDFFKIHYLDINVVRPKDFFNDRKIRLRTLHKRDFPEIDP